MAKSNYSLTCASPLPQIFAQIRNILADSTFGDGVRWNVTTASTDERRIHAVLQFSQNDDFTGVTNFLLELDIEFFEVKDQTNVLINFRKRKAGLKWYVLDEIIDSVNKEFSYKLPIALNMPNIEEEKSKPGTRISKPSTFKDSIIIAGVFAFCATIFIWLCKMANDYVLSLLNK